MIRKAKIWDVPEITEMWAAMQNEVAIPRRYADDVQKERFYFSLVGKLYRNDWSILVAEEDGKLIGFIMGNVQYFEYGTSDLIGNCDHVYVYPDHRGNSLMDKLIEQLLLIGKKAGVKSCEFITVYDTKLIEIWKHRGFLPTQVIYSKEV